MAHKKGAGSTKNGRDSVSKRLGLKLSNGSIVRAGNIILKQRGLHFKAGENVGCSTDFTLFAQLSGCVIYEKVNFKSFVIRIYS